MSTRNPFAWSRKPFVTAVVALAILSMSAVDAKAIDFDGVNVIIKTFGQWAGSKGWLPGQVMPAVVSTRVTDGNTSYDRTLNMIGSGIDSLADIGNYDWTTTPTTKLSLAHNSIMIEPGDFVGLGDLTELDLGYNGIVNIKPSSFVGLANLTSLSLFWNPIRSIEPDDFVGLDNLTHLDLGGTVISSIDSDDFARLSNLRELSLQSVNLTTIESGAFRNLGKLETLRLPSTTSFTSLNLEDADLSSLTTIELAGAHIVRVLLKNATLTQTTLSTLVYGHVPEKMTAVPTTPMSLAEALSYWGLWGHGISELRSVVELDLSGVDFAAITDLSPLGQLDHLTDLWLVGTRNLDADKLDTLLDNLDTMEDPNVEGVLHLSQADYDAFNAAGGGKLARWDAEPGHHVQIVPEPAMPILLTAVILALGLVCRRYSNRIPPSSIR